MVDNRGVGRSDESPHPFTTHEMARDIAAVLDHAGVRRAHIFGLSLGGMVAQAFALQHPERLDRLVLGCTTPGGGRAIRPRLRAFFSMARGRLASIETGCRIEAENTLSAEFLTRSPQTIQSWIELASARPVSRRALVFQALAGLRHDVFDQLSGVQAPTLVLAPDADRLIPARNSQLLATQIPRAELCWMRGAGHDFVTERPAATFRIVSEFLLSD